MDILNRFKNHFQTEKFLNEQRRNYKIGEYSIQLSNDHILPLYQKQYPMYDRIVPFLGKMSEELSGTTIIDIGANVGDTSFALLQETSKKIIAVEPEDNYYQILVNNVCRYDAVKNSVETVQAFISDKENNSFITKSNDGTARMVSADRGRLSEN